MQFGLVIRTTGSWYEIRTDNGDMISARIKGKFRLQGIRTTNPIAVGDRVGLDGDSIVEICPRVNYMIRKSSNLSKKSQIIAANIDQAFLLVSIREPETPAEFIDRFLVTAEAYKIPVTIVFNKIDLYNTTDKEMLNAYMRLYSILGYHCHAVSVKTGEGIEEIKEELRNKITLFSGNSGVGKSSFINSLHPSFNTKIAAISEVHHTGMHTTTFSEMLPYNGGYVIDTPGVKGFGVIDMVAKEVGHYFPEIFSTSKECRFANCIHRGEPGCAVIKAVEKHYISESRYASYLSILEDESEDKYR
ncbi:MAG: ribosome small subunit-dependent GTPase A [Bacteroidia bacterium]|nr:ribosome small subunit-dependent GTPase A [Bacteroidia bacterium]